MDKAGEPQSRTGKAGEPRGKMEKMGPPQSASEEASKAEGKAEKDDKAPKEVDARGDTPTTAGKEDQPESRGQKAEEPRPRAGKGAGALEMELGGPGQPALDTESQEGHGGGQSRVSEQVRGLGGAGRCRPEKGDGKGLSLGVDKAGTGDGQEWRGGQPRGGTRHVPLDTQGSGGPTGESGLSRGEILHRVRQCPNYERCPLATELTRSQDSSSSCVNGRLLKMQIPRPRLRASLSEAKLWPWPLHLNKHPHLHWGILI